MVIYSNEAVSGNVKISGLHDDDNNDEGKNGESRSKEKVEIVFLRAANEFLNRRFSLFIGTRIAERRNRDYLPLLGELRGSCRRYCHCCWECIVVFWSLPSLSLSSFWVFFWEMVRRLMATETAAAETPATETERGSWVRRDDDDDGVVGFSLSRCNSEVEDEQSRARASRIADGAVRILGNCRLDSVC